MIKMKIGIANTAEYPNIKTAVLPILGNLAAEIKNILKFHGEHSEARVSKILLTGGGARIVQLAEYLSQSLSDLSGLNVELGNPWARVPLSTDPPIVGSASLSFATAIGLALRGAGNEQ